MIDNHQAKWCINERSA